MWRVREPDEFNSRWQPNALQICPRRGPCSTSMPATRSGVSDLTPAFQILLAEDQLCVVVTGAGIISIVNNLRVSRTQAVKNRCSMIARSGRANARSVAIIAAD